MTWQVQAYFANVYGPRLIFMYLAADISAGDERSALAMHYFPGSAPSALPDVVARIEQQLRRR